MFRFIHTADIHLDSPLEALAVRDPLVAELVGGATRRTFERIIDLCLKEQVQVLIIAGDLYDRKSSPQTAAFLNQQMKRLEKDKIRVFMIRGNHDFESSAYLLPPNVHVFDGRGGVVKLEDFGVAIHGVSYTQRTVSESLLHKYKQPEAGLINIGIMHTSLSGTEGHDDYAPCSVGDLIDHGFDYWALGHIHRRQIHAEAPYVVMPGIPQGRDIQENGPKSVTMVEISDGNIKIDERFVAVAEFQRVPVDLTNVAEWSMAVEKVCASLEKVQKKDPLVICRVSLSGISPLSWKIRRNVDVFREDVCIQARQLDAVFVEEINLEDLIQQPAHTISDADPVNELEKHMLAAPNNKEFLYGAENFYSGFIKKMPKELRKYYGDNQKESEEIFQKLLLEGISEVTAAIRPFDDGGT